MPKPNCFAEEVQQDFADRSREAEELLFDVYREGRTEFLTSERAYLARELNWDEKKCRQELARVNRVARLQAVCGSPMDRQAAQDECKTSADVLAKEQPRLETKIAELQSKLASLERDARLSEKRVEDQTQAVQQLRTMCPQHIQQRVESKVSTIANTLRRDVIDAESRIHELQCCLTPAKYQNQSLYLEALRRSFREAITDHVEGRSLTYRLAPAWPGIRIAIEAELAELQSKLPGLQALYDDAVRQAELPLDFYSDPKNSES